MPSPLDLPPTQGKNPKNEEEIIERQADTNTIQHPTEEGCLGESRMFVVWGEK